MSQRRTIVVAGNGMVGHKLVETLVQRGATAEWDVHVFGEEPRHAYDRVGLSSLFDGATADDLTLAAPDFYEHNRAAATEALLLCTEVDIPHDGRP